MTTQAELRELAQKHVAAPGVQAVLTSILERGRECKAACDDLQKLTQRLAEQLENGHVRMSQERLVEVSAAAAIAAARYAGDHLTLAQTLEGLGETIDY